MKTVLIAVSVALATACGGSSGTTDRLANFTGSGWNASVTTTVTCPGLPVQSGNRTNSITFARVTAPVSATWTTFTATTTDGRNLTIATAGTASAIGQTCPFAEAGSATR